MLRRNLYFICIALFCSFAVSAQFVDPETAVDVKPMNNHLSGSWKLDFSDEFNGTAVNTSKWNIDNSTRSRTARPNIGVNDWRWKPANVSVSNGNLVLQVYKTGTNSMTNGSINSSGKYETMYGYFEARIKIGDAAKGTHTAFWLQGPNMGNVDGTANDGAEIDIFESAWTGDYTKSVVHIDGYGDSHQANTIQYNTPGIHSGFHTWGFHWTENFMTIYYDGVKKVTYGSGSNYKWVVRALEYLWLSNGASFGLSGNEYFLDLPTGYLTETQVDYIRVWKEAPAEPVLSHSGWKLLSVDSQNSNYPATNAFDGNNSTFWHTEWTPTKPTHPHQISIDLGESAKISAFSYLPRQDGNTNGTILDFDFYTSLNNVDWSAPLVSGTFATGSSEKSIILPAITACRYVKLVAKSEVNGNEFTSIAELNFTGSYDSDINGLNKNSANKTYKLYPNPFDGCELTIDISDSQSNTNFATLINLNGTEIATTKLNFGKSILSVKQKLPAGIYFLKLKIGERIETEKIVVK